MKTHFYKTVCGVIKISNHFMRIGSNITDQTKSVKTETNQPPQKKKKKKSQDDNGYIKYIFIVSSIFMIISDF